MFFEGVKVDKFLKSSSRPFHNLMEVAKRDVSIISQRII